MSESFWAVAVAFGYMGAGSFAICALPQLFKALKSRKTDDISTLFIILSLAGNIFSFFYIYVSNLRVGQWQWPQYVNYTIAFFIMFALGIVKWCGTGRNKRDK